jgi:flagellin
MRNLQVTEVNIKAAESVIRDVDYAAESANFNKMNIIAQAGTYAISQANNVSQNVMKLLQ